MTGVQTCALPIFDFIKPFENQKSLTDAEKMEAAYKISALVDDLLLKFADHTKIDDHTDMKVAMLQLKMSLDDNEKISISVESHFYDDGSMCKLIFLTDDKNHTKHRYHMESQDEVLRYDQDASEPGEIDLILADIHNSDTIDENALKSFMARTENASRNQQLEKQLGVNDQPVGPDEIDKLTQLLEGAEAIGAI